MKSKVTPNKDAFKPLKLEIAIESQEELDALGSLFNNGVVCKALYTAGFDTGNLWQQLQAAGAEINGPVAFAFELRNQ
jgi:hypothetical protein